MKKIISVILVVVLLASLSACGSQSTTANTSGEATEDTAPSTDAPSSELEESTAPPETTEKSMTSQELFDHLDGTFGTFNTLAGDEGTLYLFDLPSGKAIELFVSDNGGMYSVYDYDTGVVAVIESPEHPSYAVLEYNETKEGAIELYDYFLDWCEKAGVTSEQIVEVLNYYATMEETAPEAMTGEELYDYLAPVYGQFGSGVTKDGVTRHIIYRFELSQNNRIWVLRMDKKYEGSDEIFDTTYACMDLDEDTIAYIDLTFFNTSEESEALYDYYLAFCEDANITSEQMIEVLDFYATIATPIEFGED